jgi:hypothetical protein
LCKSALGDFKQVDVFEVFAVKKESTEICGVRQLRNFVQHVIAEREVL